MNLPLNEESLELIITSSPIMLMVWETNYHLQAWLGGLYRLGKGRYTVSNLVSLQNVAWETRFGIKNVETPVT